MQLLNAYVFFIRFYLISMYKQGKYGIIKYGENPIWEVVMLKAKPFVKWAGGKRSIIEKLISLAPEEYKTYYEPFVGGGAML